MIVMRLSGLSSGLDIDQMMKDLMRAERMPVNKLEKQRTELGWKMDAYREINVKMQALHSSIFDTLMRSSVMKKRTVASSDPNIATATASSSLGNANYTLNEVKQLATAATAKGKELNGINENSSLSELEISSGSKIEEGWVIGKLVRETAEFKEGKAQLKEKPEFAHDEQLLLINGKTYQVVDADKETLESNQVKMNEDGEMTFAEGVKLPARLQVEYVQEDSTSKERYTKSTVSTVNAQGETTESSFFFKDTDKISTVVTKMRSADAGVNVFFDEFNQSFVVSKQETGQSDNDMGDLFFEGHLFNQTLGLNENVTKGKNAIFTVNGVETQRASNTFNLSGMTITLKNESTQPISLNATTNVDDIFDTILSFVDEYNELVDFVNGKLGERYYRDYDPLTTEERDSLSDVEADRWEEKAQSGLLRNDVMLQGTFNQMRQSLYQTINSNGTIGHLVDIGITTSKDYMDGGKLEVNADKLRQAIEEDVDGVFSLFNGSDGNPGLAQNLRTNLQQGMSSIARRAGGSEGYHEQHQFAIGQQTKSIDDRISDFERRLEQKEARYWRQFTAMERAMQMANQQSESLFNLLYGNN